MHFVLHVCYLLISYTDVPSTKSLTKLNPWDPLILLTYFGLALISNIMDFDIPGI